MKIERHFCILSFILLTSLHSFDSMIFSALKLRSTAPKFRRAVLSQHFGSIESVANVLADGSIPPSLKLPLVIVTDNVPVYIFSSQAVEPQSLEQLKALARSKIPVGFVSAMPDVHLGKGATIGSVFASESYVSPNAVGVDIGCGMTAIPFSGLHKDDLTHEMKVKIQQEIRIRIPTGFNQHKTALPGVDEAIDSITATVKPTSWFEKSVLKLQKTRLQIGTLGGGNHFIEVVHDQNGRVWIMLHSGSRFAGKTTAEHYNELAAKTLKSQGKQVLISDNLSIFHHI